MIIAKTSSATPGRAGWRTVGLSGLVGAGAVCACWPLLLVWMFVGLKAGFPTEMGGMGLAPVPTFLLAGGAVALGAAVTLRVVIALLRSAGCARPGLVAVAGLPLAVVVYVAVGSAWHTLTPAPDAAMELVGVMVVPLSGAGGFALMARLTGHRASTDLPETRVV